MLSYQGWQQTSAATTNRKRKRATSTDLLSTAVAQDTAATKIQRCWRAYVASEFRNDKLPEDPITCEVIRGYPFTLIASETAVYKFDARALADYFDTTLNFSNPLTREKLNAIEVSRLQKQLWHAQNGRYRRLRQDYENRKKLAREIAEHTNFVHVVTQAIEDELFYLFRYAHRLDKAYKEMRGAIMSGNVFPVSMVSVNGNIIEHTEPSAATLATIESEFYDNVYHQMEHETFPAVRAYLFTVASMLHKNRRLSPNTIDTFCKDKILDLTQNASKFGSSRIFADSVALFFTTVRGYYATDAILKHQTRTINP